MKKNVVYGLFDPITKELRYIGYTSNQEKRFIHHCCVLNGTKEKRIWISRLKKQGLKPIMKIIEEYQTAEELPAAEEFWYGYFKLAGAELYNDPYFVGEGSKKGRKQTEETKIKIGKGNKGKLLGKSHTKDHNNKISEASIGKKLTQESRDKISKANTGKTHSEASKQKMSDSHMGVCHAEETKQKISKSSKGKILTAETKQKKCLDLLQAGIEVGLGRLLMAREFGWTKNLHKPIISY